MQFSLKYILALTAGLSLSPLHAEMVQSSSLSNDVEGSNLAARVLSKDSQNFNSRF
jgi:rare lipoprotein A